MVLQGLSRLKGHRFEGQGAVLRRLGEGGLAKDGALGQVVRPGQGQHLLHQPLHLLGLGEDVVRPPGGPLLQGQGGEELRVGENHRQRCFQLVGGVGEELALLAPGPLHGLCRPPGQDDRHPQQQQKGRQGNAQIRAHHLPEHGPLHGHVHKGQPPVKAVVPPEIAEAVALDHALRGLLVQTVL